jgi:hypothetical protein
MCNGGFKGKDTNLKVAAHHLCFWEVTGMILNAKKAPLSKKLFVLHLPREKLFLCRPIKLLGVWDGRNKLSLQYSLCHFLPIPHHRQCQHTGRHHFESRPHYMNSTFTIIFQLYIPHSLCSIRNCYNGRCHNNTNKYTGTLIH